MVKVKTPFGEVELPESGVLVKEPVYKTPETRKAEEKRKKIKTETPISGYDVSTATPVTSTIKTVKDESGITRKIKTTIYEAPFYEGGKQVGVVKFKKIEDVTPAEELEKQALRKEFPGVHALLGSLHPSLREAPYKAYKALETSPKEHYLVQVGKEAGKILFGTGMAISELAITGATLGLTPETKEKEKLREHLRTTSGKVARGTAEYFASVGQTITAPFVSFAMTSATGKLQPYKPPSPKQTAELLTFFAPLKFRFGRARTRVAELTRIKPKTAIVEGPGTIKLELFEETPVKATGKKTYYVFRDFPEGVEMSRIDVKTKQKFKEGEVTGDIYSRVTRETEITEFPSIVGGSEARVRTRKEFENILVSGKERARETPESSVIYEKWSEKGMSRVIEQTPVKITVGKMTTPEGMVEIGTLYKSAIEKGFKGGLLDVKKPVFFKTKDVFGFVTIRRFKPSEFEVIKPREEFISKPLTPKIEGVSKLLKKPEEFKAKTAKGEAKLAREYEAIVTPELTKKEILELFGTKEIRVTKTRRTVGIRERITERSKFALKPLLSLREKLGLRIPERFVFGKVEGVGRRLRRDKSERTITKPRYAFEFKFKFPEITAKSSIFRFKKKEFESKFSFVKKAEKLVKESKRAESKKRARGFMLWIKKGKRVERIKEIFFSEAEARAYAKKIKGVPFKIELVERTPTKKVILKPKVSLFGKKAKKR